MSRFTAIDVTLAATLPARTRAPNAQSRLTCRGRIAMPSRLDAVPTRPIRYQALAESVVSITGAQATFQVLGRTDIPARAAICATLAPAWLSSQPRVTVT